jgi:Zn-dependent oligopeptidase
MRRVDAGERFRTKLLAATKEAAYRRPTDKNALKGLSDAQLAAAAEAAKETQGGGLCAAAAEHDAAAGAGVAGGPRDAAGGV